MTHADSRRNFGNNNWGEGVNRLKGYLGENRFVVIIAPNFTNQEQRFVYHAGATCLVNMIPNHCVRMTV
jgi:hypothetical protein